ncbi:MAG: TonB-dependent receptor [Xanthomonadales bacterium]|nr:TonB-dependent receptor [Xanthomonadales bacterium]
MDFRPFNKSLAATLIAATFVVPAGSVVAQVTGGESEYMIEEIIVTARKRGAESLQDVPTSITALSQDMLETMGVVNFEDFAYQIPGLTFTDAGKGERRYIIRGVQSGGQQQVAVYYDEIALPGVQSSTSDSGSQTTDLMLYDVERVEVLKGPQGTTFGANSQTGTVRFITNKPVLDGYEASVKMSAGSTEHGGENYGAFGMLNMPLVENKLGVRIVAYYNEDAGFVDNVRLGLEDINWYDTSGVRAIMRFEPSDSLTFDAMVWAQERDNGGADRFQPFDSFSQDDNPNGIGDRDNVSPQAFFQTGDLQVGDFTQTPKPDDQVIASLTMNWDLGPAAVTAAASYYDREFGFKFDSSWILFFLGIDPSGSIDDPANPDPALGRPDLFPALTDQKQDLEQQMFEARVVSTWDKRWNYLGGFFFRNRESNFQSFVPVVDPVTGLPFDPGVPFAPPPQVGAGIAGCHPCVFARTASKDIEETAFFGELTFDLTDRIELLAGLRWFEVDQSDIGETVFPFALFPPNPSLPNTQSAKEDQLIQKYQVSYQPTDNMTLFAVASQGYRLGGTNNQGVVAIPDLFESDEVWNYEIGYKTQWFGNRLTVNGAIFNLDWDNMQVNAEDPTGAFGFVTNAGAAEVWGTELEVFALPTPNLSIGFGVSWLPKRELTEDQSTIVIIGGEEVPLFAPGKKGDDIPNIPEVTINGNAHYSYAIPAAADWSGWVRGEFFYRSDSRSQLQSFQDGNANDRPLDGYGIVNLRAGFDNSAWDGQIVFFVTNIADKQGDVQITGANGEPTSKVTNRPRTFGVEFSKRF